MPFIDYFKLTTLVLGCITHNGCSSVGSKPGAYSDLPFNGGKRSPQSLFLSKIGFYGSLFFLLQLKLECWKTGRRADYCIC